jgi:exodeoxyribonuclease VII large subunit
MTYGRSSDHNRYSRRGQIESADLPGASKTSPVSITELNDRTRHLIENSFGVIWVRGEVTDFKKHKNGHWYFCLRDHTSQIQCVVWSKDQFRIPAPPDEGMEVVAQAMMSFFQQRGQIQLRIGRMEAAGDGLWRKAMELTIAKLTADGLLAADRKRALPRFPKCLAVVTSTSGAAVRDIVSVAHRRRPGLRIVVSGAVVQGEMAPRSICHAISRVMSWGCADVLIVGRGGGSRDDLWAFNDERVARALAASNIPTISAVGHEIDTTICDLVADARAATPSAAAETAIPSLSDIIASLESQKRRLVNSVNRRRESAVLDLKTVARDMQLASSRVVERRRGIVS